MDPSPDEIVALAAELNTAAAALAAAENGDPAVKTVLARQVVMQAKKVIWQCQPPFDAIMDHVVNSYAVGAVLALIEIGVFEAIPATGSVTASDLAAKCGAGEELIVRLMRQLVCVNVFNEVAVNEWAHNRLSIGLSEHVGERTGKHFLQVCMEEMYPSFLQLNQYMRKFGKGDVKTYTSTPHSWQNDMVDSNFWQVLTSQPGRLDRFSRALSLFDANFKVVAIFPFEQILKPGNSADRVLAVDIGGGRGRALLDLRTGCPSLVGKLILQDVPAVLETVSDDDLPATANVIKMAHDFFTPQPVQHAQVYYIRRVMHDWQDDDAVRILHAIKPAMAPDSRILVSDMAMPEPAHPSAAGAVWMDLMMLTIGGKERTRSDWEKLARLAGLKLCRVWTEPEKHGPLCVVEYMLPS